MAELSTQAQSVGDLIGRAIRLYRRNILLIVQVLLLPSAGATLGKICLQWGIINLKDASSLAAAIGFCVFGFSLSLWFLWILTLKQLALLRVVNSEDQDFAKAYKTIKENGWATFSIFLLTHLLVVANVGLFVTELVVLALVANLAVLNGVALLVLLLFGFIGFLLGALYITLFAFIEFSIIALGKQNFIGLLKEGLSLLGRDLLRGSWFTVLLMVALGSLVPPLTLPLMGLTAMDALKPNLAAQAWLGLGKYSLFTMVVAQAWESLVNMILWPIMFFAYGYLYQNLRMRQYASDLNQTLEKLQQSRV